MWFKLISTRVFFDIFLFFSFVYSVVSWLSSVDCNLRNSRFQRVFPCVISIPNSTIFFAVRSFRFRFVAVRWVRANIEITYKPCCKWYYFVVGYVSWGCRYFSSVRCRMSMAGWLTGLTWLLPRFDQPPHNTALITSASFLHIIIVMIIIIISQCCCCIPVLCFMDLYV